jgi:hypothetical protein
LVRFVSFSLRALENLLVCALGNAAEASFFATLSLFFLSFLFCLVDVGEQVRATALV